MTNIFAMNPCNDMLIDAINKNDISCVYYCLRKGNCLKFNSKYPIKALVRNDNIIEIYILKKIIP